MKINLRHCRWVARYAVWFRNVQCMRYPQTVNASLPYIPGEPFKKLTQILTSNGSRIERNQQIIASFTKLLHRHGGWTSDDSIPVKVDDGSEDRMRDALGHFVFAPLVGMCKLHAGTEHSVEEMQKKCWTIGDWMVAVSWFDTHRPSIVFGCAVNIPGSMVKRVSSTSKVIRFSAGPVAADCRTVGEGVAVEQWAKGDDDECTAVRFICWDFVWKLLLLLLRLFLHIDNKDTKPVKSGIFHPSKHRRTIKSPYLVRFLYKRRRRSSSSSLLLYELSLVFCCGFEDISSTILFRLWQNIENLEKHQIFNIYADNANADRCVQMNRMNSVQCNCIHKLMSFNSVNLKFFEISKVFNEWNS